MRGTPSTSSVSLESARRWSLAYARAIRRSNACRSLRLTCSPACSRTASMSRRAYQSSRLRIPAKARIASRYERTAASTVERRTSVARSSSRPAMAMLAASRLTSHSHGPRAVSSKSLMSKTISRSGAAKPPKFDRCASPQSWASRPDRGVPARSAAISAAAPRKKANGEVSIRPWRIGRSSGMRSAPSSSSSSTGGRRPAAGSQPAWSPRRAAARAARPSAARSWTEGCGIGRGTRFAVVAIGAMPPRGWWPGKGASRWSGLVSRTGGDGRIRA